MLRFIGRLIVIPLGIVLAAFCALLFLGIVGMVQPSIAEAIATTAFKTMDRAFRTVMEGEEAIKQFGWSLALFSRFVVVVLFLPVTLVAVVTEFFGLRPWLLHALGVALLTALMPFAMMPELIGGAPFASGVTGLLAATGALAGSIYWMIAGRKAGADPKTVEERATVKAPRIQR
jgi:uncharacterized membrane protein YecN with MAPEG domain